MVYRLYRMQLVIDIQILHCGKVEIHGLRLRAGDDLSVFDLQTCIGVILFVPGYDR